MTDSRTALFEQRHAELEVILPEPEHCFRWYEHDYPYPLARWNHHPEFEIHLIRQGSGKLVAGDYFGAFGAGHVALIGPDLPHDWIGDLRPGEFLKGRDVVLQFDGAAILALRSTLPELGELQHLFERARRGLEFTGATALQAARLMEDIGPARGLERLILFLQLINTLIKAPVQEAHTLASACYAPTLDDRSSERVHKAFDYLLNELTGDVRLSVIAQRLEMSEPGFSRFFKRVTGHGFIDLMRKLRVQRACRLLLQTEMSVSDICFEVGYENLSNFNRHFRIEMEQTPSEYRRGTAMNLFNRNGLHASLPHSKAHSIVDA
ncbi:AraC-type DNA-binding protein [Pseudomonas arsenicoxydans]|jgi:AraC-like DNA-binding protein|uniref:AraC-type DNA-binding protein n=1 Tax=Pseudomonas arsenicoxydans TaxID=702115 RepID=A0A1H0NVK6_9PSED|nr:AraC family transcriptional regulator [Pseudomonas arsenicoxydans]SDO96430.1 AraC-type DNA-binding protein [Pseudomonas arsenicoxydans]